MIRSTALLLVSLSAFASADVRTPVPLAEGGQLLTGGNRSAVVVEESTPGARSVLLSDGRGLVWSGPHAVVPPGSTGVIASTQSALVGDQIFVTYADDRFDTAQPATTSSTPFLRVFDAATGVAGPEIQIPVGVAPKDVAATLYDLVAVPVAGSVHLHLASRREVFDSAAGTSRIEIALASSLDGGSTWLPLQVITPAAVGFGILNRVRVVADGNQVHVLYSDFQGTFAPVLFDQRSLDGGLTLDFPQPKPVPTAQAAWVFDVDFRGSTLAVAYETDDSAGGFSESRVVTSSDGGVTYNKAARVEPPSGSEDFVESFGPVVAIVGSGPDIVAGARGWGGPFEIVAVIHSPDGGKTWPDKTAPYEDFWPPVTGLQLDGSGPGRSRVALTWATFGFGASDVRGVTSLDGGASFGPSFGLAAGGPSSQQLAWNDLYQNALVSFWIPQPTGPALPHVGGWRPQSIAPMGFTAGSSSIDAQFKSFDGGADLSWLFLSTSTSSLPLGDGRELGIGASPLFASLLPLVFGGSFAAPLDVFGNGGLLPIAVPAQGVPPGLTLFAVGVSFDLSSATVVDISDVVQLDT